MNWCSGRGRCGRCSCSCCGRGRLTTSHCGSWSGDLTTGKQPTLKRIDGIIKNIDGTVAAGVIVNVARGAADEGAHRFAHGKLRHDSMKTSSDIRARVPRKQSAKVKWVQWSSNCIITLHRERYVSAAVQHFAQKANMSSTLLTCT